MTHQKKPASGAEPEAGLNKCHHTSNTGEIFADDHEVCQFQAMAALAAKRGAQLTQTITGAYMLKRGTHSVHSQFLCNLRRYLNTAPS